MPTLAKLSALVCAALLAFWAALPLKADAAEKPGKENKSAATATAKAKQEADQAPPAADQEQAKPAAPKGQVETPAPDAKHTTHDEPSSETMHSAVNAAETAATRSVMNSIYILILAGFVGFEVIRQVSPLLHTPLMSATNAISGISLVGSIVAAGSGEVNTASHVLGFVAVTAATINVVGGFMITDRMLRMFKLRGKSQHE